jgi:hypothetical protein
METIKKKGMSTGKKVAIGAGVGLAAAAAAYFLTGKRGVKNRAAIKEWAVKANEELAQAVKKVGNLTKFEYEKIVATIAKKYKNLDQEDLKELVAMLQSHWKEFSKKK